MDVRPGYKLTEVGVIPKEWEALPAREIGVFKGGSVFPLTAQGGKSGAYPFFKVSDMNHEGNETFMTTANHYISEQTRKRLGATVTPADSIVFAKVGAAVFLERKKILGQPSCIDNNMAAYVLDRTRADVRYVHSLMLTKKLGALVATTALPALNGKQLGEMALALPPLPEQRAIAAALSDVDAMLGGLHRLIAKKRDLKQATMQQLLTGQTRLSGFHGEWEVKRLGEIGSTYGGLTGKSKADFGVGTGQYVTFMNVMTNVVIDCGLFDQVRVSPTESQNRVSQGDLLFNGSSETPEEVAICSLMAENVPNLFLNSFCFGFRIREKQEADGLFLAYYLRASPGRDLMKSLAQGSTRYNLSKGALLEASVRLPRKAEQAAIATVLADMDAELSALDARLAKTRALKQAMMQELLTGRTRLVRPEDEGAVAC